MIVKPSSSTSLNELHPEVCLLKLGGASVVKGRFWNFLNYISNNYHIGFRKKRLEPFANYVHIVIQSIFP